ncbi:hypothetical protein E2562_037389, partial [Oryza meyeriana var. granulata]
MDASEKLAAMLRLSNKDLRLDDGHQPVLLQMMAYRARPCALASTVSCDGLDAVLLQQVGSRRPTCCSPATPRASSACWFLPATTTTESLDLLHHDEHILSVMFIGIDQRLRPCLLLGSALTIAFVAQGVSVLIAYSNNGSDRKHMAKIVKWKGSRAILLLDLVLTYIFKHDISSL